MAKVKQCYSFEDKLVASIERVSLKKGISKSEVVNNYAVRGLSKEHELTAVERLKYQDEIINGALDSVLAVFKISCDGDILLKFRHALYTCAGISKQKIERNRYGIMELSLFEVLNDIKDSDMALFDKLIIEMGSFGRIRQRYFNLYPK